MCDELGSRQKAPSWGPDPPPPLFPFPCSLARGSTRPRGSAPSHFFGEDFLDTPSPLSPRRCYMLPCHLYFLRIRLGAFVTPGVVGGAAGGLQEGRVRIGAGPVPGARCRT